jgi:hypothetical protein
VGRSVNIFGVILVILFVLQVLGLNTTNPGWYILLGIAWPLWGLIKAAFGES